MPEPDIDRKEFTTESAAPKKTHPAAALTTASARSFCSSRLFGAGAGAVPMPNPPVAMKSSVAGRICTPRLGGRLSQLYLIEEKIEGHGTTVIRGFDADRTSPISTAGTPAASRSRINSATESLDTETTRPPAVWGSKVK